MIRPLTCVTVLMACGSGFFLYQTKHQAQVVDRQIERAVKAITATKMQTRELAAAWTVLGSPDRLQQLANQYLDITPVTPSQFVAMADLDSRLPAPRALPPPGADTPSPDLPADAGSDTTPIAAAEPAGSPTTATAAAPRAVAATQGTAPADQVAQPARNDPGRTEPAKVEPAKVEPSRLAVEARPIDHKPSDLPRPARDVAQARPAPPRAPSRSPQVAELSRPAPAPQGVPPVPIAGSLLGMAHSAVAPPVPLPVRATSFDATGN